jgi:Ca2+-binding RTX toxin-like protein
MTASLLAPSDQLRSQPEGAIAMTCDFQSLEARQMMSAAIKNTILTINGTELNDTITIDHVGNSIKVIDNGVNRSFDASKVSRLIVRGNAGNDKITASATFDKPMIMFGGAGNDTLTGGAKDDRISGELGDDTLNGGPEGTTYPAAREPATRPTSPTAPSIW